MYNPTPPLHVKTTLMLCCRVVEYAPHAGCARKSGKEVNSAFLANLAGNVFFFFIFIPFAFLPIFRAPFRQSTGTSERGSEGATRA